MNKGGGTSLSPKGAEEVTLAELAKGGRDRALLAVTDQATLHDTPQDKSLIDKKKDQDTLHDTPQ